jgi:hypothetical protein
VKIPPHGDLGPMIGFFLWHLQRGTPEEGLIAAAREAGRGESFTDAELESAIEVALMDYQASERLRLLWPMPKKDDTPEQRAECYRQQDECKKKTGKDLYTDKGG